MLTLLPSSSPTPTPIPADINGDGKVDIKDYNTLVGNFDKTGSNIPGDLDGSGVINVYDYNLFMTNYSVQTPAPTSTSAPTSTPTPSSTTPRVTALSWIPTKCISWNTKGNCNKYAPAKFIVKGNNFITGTPKIRIYQHATTTLIYDGPATPYTFQNVNTATGYGELVWSTSNMPWSWGSYNAALLTPSDVTVYYP